MTLAPRGGPQTQGRCGPVGRAGRGSPGEQGTAASPSLETPTRWAWARAGVHSLTSSRQAGTRGEYPGLPAPKTPLCPTLQGVPMQAGVRGSCTKPSSPYVYIYFQRFLTTLPSGRSFPVCRGGVRGGPFGSGAD